MSRPMINMPSQGRTVAVIGDVFRFLPGLGIYVTNSI